MKCKQCGLEGVYSFTTPMDMFCLHCGCDNSTPDPKDQRIAELEAEKEILLSALISSNPPPTIKIANERIAELETELEKERQKYCDLEAKSISVSHDLHQTINILHSQNEIMRKICVAVQLECQDPYGGNMDTLRKLGKEIGIDFTKEELENQNESCDPQYSNTWNSMVISFNNENKDKVELMIKVIELILTGFGFKKDETPLKDAKE